MSASDAAPLPRLGEVFFDVRGSSRSMRLSWYADTDVAVFSIWQGGMCTGTFRLPMGDLTRMIEILQHGPPGRDEHMAGERGSAAYREDRYADADYDDDGDHHGADYQNAGYGDHADGVAEYGEPGYGADDYGPPAQRGGEYDRGAGHAGTGYGDPGYDDAGHRDPGHRDPGYRDPGYRSGGPSDYRQPDYERPPRGRRRAEWPDEDRYQPDVTGQRSVAPGQTGYDESGYGQERFVPPYVRPQPDSTQARYSDDSEYRLPADPGARARHSAGRHSGRQPQ